MRESTFQDYSERMLRVLVHIQENLDASLPLDEVAAVAHFSPYHFHRIFRGMVGESLRSHIRRLRLERAAGQLLQGDDAVTHIALRAGYDSHEAFTRAFKAMTGVPPSDWRDARREADAPDAPLRVRYTPSGQQLVFEATGDGGRTMDVRIVDEKPRRVAFVRHVGPYDQCGAAWGKLCSHLGRKGLMGRKNAFIGLGHDDPDVTPAEKIRYDACVEVGEDFAAEGEVGVQVIEGGPYAVTVHRGPYEKLNETYSALCGQWLPRSGYSFRDRPSFEIYLNDVQRTKPEDLLTEIHVPLAP